MVTKITQADIDQIAADARQATEAAEEFDTERAVVTREPNALTNQEPVGVSGAADPTDFVLPFMSIVQKMSPAADVHKPGTLLKSTGDETDIMEFVILHVARTRTYYDGDASELLCASRDRMTGSPRSQALLDELGVEAGPVPCTVCPHYQDDQYQKVACKFDYLLTLYDLTAREPFLFRAKGASLKTWRQRLSPILQGSQPPWFASFEMSVKSVTNKRGQSWFEPEVKPLERYDADQRAVWADYATPFGTTKQDAPEFDDLPFE